MYKDKESIEPLRIVEKKPDMTFGVFLKFMIVALTLACIFSFGSVFIMQYYFGVEGTRTFIRVGLGIFVAILIWLMVIVTTMVTNKHTSNVVKNVTQSIVETQSADDRGEIGRMMAMIYREQMMNGQSKRFYQDQQGPMIFEPQNKNYLPKPADDRFDYEGHLSIEDVWSQSSGLK